MHPNVPDSDVKAIVPVDPNATKLVPVHEPDRQDDVRQETEALITAIQQRATAELAAATRLLRQNYLSAVRQARSEIEQEPVLASDRLDDSIEQMQKQADKTWLVLAGELEATSVRLMDLARLAWKNLQRLD